MTDPTSRTPHGSPRFSFVVVADTHVNEAERTSTSPYETNHLANPRARHVFAEIAAMRPAPRFVVHLGDIVHPVPSLPAFHDAVARFKAIASQLPVPLHVIPGNHDVGDKTVDWMPAEQVCDDLGERHARHAGRRRCSACHACPIAMRGVRYGDARHVMLARLRRGESAIARPGRCRFARNRFL